MIGRRGSAHGVPTGHRIPAQGNAQGTQYTVHSTVNGIRRRNEGTEGTLKERRIFGNRGRLPNPSRYGVPSERLMGVPRIPRVAPWAGMRRPFRAEADATLLLVSGANRPWSNNERLLSGVAQMWISSLFCQSESIKIDLAKALSLSWTASLSILMLLGNCGTVPPH